MRFAICRVIAIVDLIVLSNPLEYPKLRSANINQPKCTMKSDWKNYLQKVTRNPTTKRFSVQDIELVSDELALEVRGGDKDYSPTYEHTVDKQQKFTDPSILLKL